MSSPVVIPNVGTLTSSVLSPQQVSVIYQALVMQMLGIVPPANPLAPTGGEDILAYARVRVEFPPEGQPAWLPNEDVAFIAALLVPGDYTRIRDFSAAVSATPGLFTLTAVYTRQWRIDFSVYGPSSARNSAQIKSCLFLDFVHDTLALQNLYSLPCTEDPRRNPENFAKQWWERFDFGVLVNEQVTETIDLPTMESIEVIIGNYRGTQNDQTIVFP